MSDSAPSVVAVVDYARVHGPTAGALPRDAHVGAAFRWIITAIVVLPHLLGLAVILFALSSADANPILARLSSLLTR